MYGYRKRGRQVFNDLAQDVLPGRLKAQGYAVGSPGMALFEEGQGPSEAEVSIEFWKGRCHGFLYATQKGNDECYFIELQSRE
jgi:hypothetical protein